MADNVDTVTVDKLVSLLKKYPGDTLVYLSRDSEGNGFGTMTSSGWSEEYHKQDTALALFPITEHIESDEVWPKYFEEMENEK